MISAFSVFPVSLNCKQYNTSHKADISTMTAHKYYINSVPSWRIVQLFSQLSLNVVPEQAHINDNMKDSNIHIRFITTFHVLYISNFYKNIKLFWLKKKNSNSRQAKVHKKYVFQFISLTDKSKSKVTSENHVAPFRFTISLPKSIIDGWFYFQTHPFTNV